MCGRGLHSLGDPLSVAYKKNGNGKLKRFCRACKNERDRQRYAHRELPDLVRQPTDVQLEIIQARADGFDDYEIARDRQITPAAVRKALQRVRVTLGPVPSTAAAIAVLLAHELITPDRNAPQPTKSLQGAPYVRSMLDLVQGRRAPFQPLDVQRLRMLDALYAWNEPHAVSKLWAARLITTRDVLPLFAKEK